MMTIRLGETVQMRLSTGTDTSPLLDVYNIHFALRDAAGLTYRKLSGTLTIRRTVQGG